jgi:tetratricopeptide (TPR) repeat protein
VKRRLYIHCLAFGLTLAVVLSSARFWTLGAPADDAAAGPRKAVEPAAPVLTGAIVAALQEGRFADAVAELDRRDADPKTKADEKTYDSLIRGIAERLAGRLPQSRAAFTEGLKAAPKGPWAAKLRAELASTELAAGQVASAEALARQEAEALLDDARKDKLASIYQVFAKRLLNPSNPSAKPDPEGAYALFAQARELAKSANLRAELLLAMANASQAAGNHPRAANDFQTYLRDYPKGAGRLPARFGLGQTQLTMGQALPARLTWSDLARDLEKVDTQDAADIRARSLHGIAKTYGVPNPPNDTALSLGVSALKRLLGAYPGHALSITAAYEIAQSFQARGKSQEALDAYGALLARDAGRGETEDDRETRLRLQMSAQFQMGLILQGQQKFDDAIAAWKGYLAKFPNGPQGADSQRAILDTQLLIAADHQARERYEQARAAWTAFVAANPLDARVPEALFSIGESFASQKKWEEAIAAWESLASKFPNTEPAAHGQFRIAQIFEDEKGDPAGAIDRYKKVAADPWKSQAIQHIAVMESKALTVVTARAFRSGETPRLKITSRNIEKLTFTAYKLNPEAYFRKKHALESIENLDIGLVAPDSEWTAPVAAYSKYKPVVAEYDLKDLKLPGAYVVKVTDEKTLQATTLVLGTDIDAIFKTSQAQLLVFVQDMKTGNGRAGARVLVSEGDAVILDAKTGADGVVLKSWDKPRSPNAALKYLVMDGADVAGSGLGVPQKVAQGLTPRAYLYTDRPAYRPGQSVELRGVVREVADGQYSAPANAVYRLEITDSRGRRFVHREVKLSAFGTFHETIPLDESAPVGAYRVRAYQPGKSDFAGNFVVQAYKLEKIDLNVEPTKTVYYRGETVKAEVIARYQYGTPLAHRQVIVHLPDGRVINSATDNAGKLSVEFPTEGFAEEQRLRILAQLPQDNVAAAADVSLAIRGFRIEPRTNRDVYLDGESFPLTITTLDAQGEPTGRTLSVAIIKQVERAGQVTEREVSRQDAKTDGKSGTAVVPVTVKDEDGGAYLLRVAGADQFGNTIVADRALTISGKKDETRLRLLSDRLDFKVGETAHVRLHSRAAAGTALLAWEADRILKYQLVQLKEGDNDLSWAVDGAQFPNFTLTAGRMDKTRFDSAQLNLRVARDLRVTVAPTKPKVGPGESVEVDVTTVDQLGQPVSAELSLALVDRSLLRLFADRLPPIGAFFHNQERTGSFATESTNTFHYHPATVPVPEAVVEEQERQLAELAFREGRDKAAAGAKADVTFGVAPMDAAAARAPAPTEPAAPGAPAGLPAPAQAPSEMYAKELAARGAVAGDDGGKHFKDADGKLADENGVALGESKRLEKSVLGRRAGLGMAGGMGGGGGRLGGQAAQAQPREQFVETAYWNPNVVTGKDGKARVTFRAPMALSEYRFTARGVSGSDTLAGQTTAELAVRKGFFVDLKPPSMLTQGDKPRFAASVHHTGVTGKLEVKLAVYAGGRQMTYPKTADIKTDGIEEIVFDPFDVPEAENVRLAISASVGDTSDEMVVEVPVRPWGVQAFASASGASKDDATVFVGLPQGRTYDIPEMLIVVSPSLRRMLIELALGRDFYPLGRRVSALILPPPGNTVADRASDLLAATSALQYLRATKASDAPEAGRLSDRIQGLVSELVTLQNDDGGWPWVGGQPGQARPSDPATSARVAWALASAQPLGLSADTPVLDKATTHLAQIFARIDAADHDTRAAVLHALATHKKATFEQANALNRERQNLSDVALAYLALTLAELDRAPLASEVLGVLVPRAKTENAAPGSKPRRYWEGRGRSPIVRGAVEATALASFALARIRPQDEVLDGAIDWLQAHRMGTGWQPHKAKGPALAALGAYYAKGQSADDRYRLVITVNDDEVYKADVTGTLEGKAITVPRKALKVGDNNRVRFDIEGRGQYGYAVTLTGFTREFAPDQDRANKPFVIGRRVYFPAEPEFDGRALPTGFGVAVNPKHFENTVTQVALGGRARVQIDAYRNEPAGRPAWEREFLVLEEHLPAGTTLVEGSVQSQASHYELADGVLTFYFAPNQYPGGVRYDVYGYLPGQYRALPPELRSAYEPGRRHLGPAGDLRVLSPGEKTTDPYTPTPDELYARGKALYDAGQLAEAAEPLEALWGGYTLRDDIAKDAARMLLYVHIKDYNPRKVVQYFEILKEKAPELVIPFDDIRVVGRAYGDINEHERAYLVWRAVAEASYLEDARVGEVLRQRGQTLEGIAMLLDLWREHPNSAAIESDFFGLSQLLASLAGKATSDPNLRRELASAGVNKSELLLQAIRLTQIFLSQSPKNPLADEASLALVGNFLELEDYDSVVKLAARYAKLYPKSTLFDSFQYSEALGQFYLGKYDRAIELAESIAKATYKDANSVEQPSPNKWQALYILGQIYDARRKPAQAVSYYEKVAERFSDAADAVRSFTRKDLKLPEVSVIRPSTAPKVAAAGGVSVLNATLRNLPNPRADEPKPEYPDKLELNFRNIAEVDVKVYPVDLMRLYLTRRNLDGIAGIDLAGITPLLETTIKLGDGADFEDRLKSLDLPLEKEGAYLVMVRGENLYASGIVLVSPLNLEVAEEHAAGRVRVTVRDARTGELRPKVQVKVIGSDNPSFFSGETDLRGVFVAEGLRGQVTAVARKGTAQYAFHRGTDYVGTPPQPAKPAAANAPAPPQAGEPQSLEQNLRMLNDNNRMRQIERLNERYNAAPAGKGVQVQKAY